MKTVTLLLTLDEKRIIDRYRMIKDWDRGGEIHITVTLDKKKCLINSTSRDMVDVEYVGAG